MTFPTNFYRPHIEGNAEADRWPWQKLGYVYHRGRGYVSAVMLTGDARGLVKYGRGEFTGYVYAWTKAPCNSKDMAALVDYIKHNAREINDWVQSLPADAREVVYAGQMAGG